MDSETARRGITERLDRLVVTSALARRPVAAVMQAARIFAAKIRLATFGRAGSTELLFGDAANRPLVRMGAVRLDLLRLQRVERSVRVPAPA